MQGQVVILELIIDFNTILAIVTRVAVAVVLLSLLLVIRVSIFRRSVEQREHQLRSLRAQWKPILSGPPQHREKISPIRKTDVAAWIRMWNEAHEAAYGKPDAALKRAYLNELASRLNMASQALRYAHHRDVVERLAGITMLGHLRRGAGKLLLRELCDSPNPLVSIAAARARLQNDRVFASKFVTLMAERSDWSAGKLVAIVSQEREALSLALLDACKSGSARSARALVPYLQYLQPGSVLPVLRRVIETAPDPQTLAAALKVLARIGAPEDALLAAALARHADWRVRVQAANTLAALGAQSSAIVLTALLDDSQWWVRYRAAQALSAVADRAHFDLTPVLQNHEDRFAREALAQAVAERAPLLQGEIAS